MTSKRTKSSPMGGRQDVPAGTVQPCPFKASVKCPGCGLWICPGHSRRITSMRQRDGSELPNAGKCKCSNCGAILK